MASEPYLEQAIQDFGDAVLLHVVEEERTALVNSVLDDEHDGAHKSTRYAVQTRAKLLAKEHEIRGMIEDRVQLTGKLIEADAALHEEKRARQMERDNRIPFEMLEAKNTTIATLREKLREAEDALHKIAEWQLHNPIAVAKAAQERIKS